MPLRLATLLLGVLVGALAGCGSSPAPRTPSDRFFTLQTQNRRERARISADAKSLERRRHVRPRTATPLASPLRAATTAAVTRPPIVSRPIPFPERRRQEMAAYSLRHYGRAEYALVAPKVIVEHYTASSTFASAYQTFAADVPDSELHELPGTCAHFVIDRDGTIYQLVGLELMCRHTVGLNYTAIGIEHVGSSDQEILSNPAQIRASLALTRWLRCRHSIAVGNVIGHNESLSSPYHHELVPRLRTQTHGDWVKADMDGYRARLAALGC